MSALFPTPVFQQTTINSPSPSAQFNPHIVNVPDLTGVVTDAQGATLHPAMMQFNFGSQVAPDILSGITSTMFYHQLEYYAGGTGMTGTRGGLRIHGVQVAYSPGQGNTSVGMGGLQEILGNLGGSVLGGAGGHQYAGNWITRLAGNATTCIATSTGTTTIALSSLSAGGSINIGDTVVGITNQGGAPVSTTIQSQSSGTTGLAGNYVTNNPTTFSADLIYLQVVSPDPTTNATFIRVSQGVEMDMSHVAGCSVEIKNAITAGSFFFDHVRGSVHDSAFNVSSVGGSCGVNMAYAVTDVGGKFPLRETDYVLRCVNNVGQQNILGGIDFIGPNPNRIHITGAIVNAEHFVVDGPTGNVTSDGIGLFKSGVQSIGGNLVVSNPVSSTVPTDDGSVAQLFISQSFAAAGETVFWNTRYPSTLAFDFEQITAPGVSISVASFSQTLATFPSVRAASVIAPAAGNLALGTVGVIANSATSGYPKMPTIHGAPTGALSTGAFGFDDTDSKLYIYNTATTSWKSIQLI